MIVARAQGPAAHVPHDAPMTTWIQRGWVALLALLASTCVQAPAAAADPTTAVAAALTASADAWNHGDLNGFMRIYENSPRTVYVGSKTIVRGYAAIRAHYATTYRPANAGHLSVSGLEVRPLGASYALAVAHWHLQRKGMKDGGLFTLVFHRSATGWYIINDHTP